MFRIKNKKENVRRPSTGYQDRQKVFSYYANRSTPEVRVGRNLPRQTGPSVWRHRLQQLPIFLSVMVIAVAGLYALLLTNNPRVQLLTSAASVARKTSDYQAYAQGLLAASISNRSKLTINTSDIESKLKQHFPEINTAAVSLPLLGSRPIVQIETVKPAFMLVTNNSGSYYITADGFTTDQAADYVARPGGIPTLTDQSGISLKAGSQVMTSTSVLFIDNVLAQLQAKGAKVSSLALAPTPYELWVYMAGTPYYVKFNMQGDARQQAGTFLAVRDYLTGKGKTPASYIDVRAEDRAYFK